MLSPIRFRRLLQAGAACLSNGKTSLSPKLTPLLTVSLVLGCMVCSPAAARPNCADWNSKTFFEKASVGDVAGCLKEGADPNTRDKYGLTPLHSAAISGTPAVVRLLLDADADLNARANYRWTPLHSAAFGGTSPAVVKVLLDAGADLNARANYRWTPLHVAVAAVPARVAAFSSKTEALAMVKVLLDAGADPSVRDRDGETPFDLILDDSPFRGTHVYYQLKNARSGHR